MRTILHPIGFLVVSLFATACAHPQDAASPAGPSACPPSVTTSIAKSYPTAKISKCKAERAEGRDQFEVKLENGGEQLEVDVAPDGTILQTESAIPVEQIPAKVMSAFTAKYPNAKPIEAEKQVRTGKGTFYELKFAAEPKPREVTFAEDGTFVEEE